METEGSCYAVRDREILLSAVFLVAIVIEILFASCKFLMTEVDDMVYHERNKMKRGKQL